MPLQPLSSHPMIVRRTVKEQMVTTTKNLRAVKHDLVSVDLWYGVGIAVLQHERVVEILVHEARLGGDRPACTSLEVLGEQFLVQVTLEVSRTNHRCRFD